MRPVEFTKVFDPEYSCHLVVPVASFLARPGWLQNSTESSPLGDPVNST